MKYHYHLVAAVATLCLVISAFAITSPSRRGIAKTNEPSNLVNTQELEKEVLQERPNPKDPIELTEIKVHEKVVRPKEKFTEDSEWIKKTSLKLKNKSTKTVSYIQVNVDFPETATSGIMLQEQYFFGRHPVYNTPKNKQPLSLKPGESLDVSLAEEFDRVKKMIESRHSPIGSISKILIRLRDIGFEDGTIYAAGAFFKKNPDANSPNKWIQVEQ
jgi:hypothetical protein